MRSALLPLCIALLPGCGPAPLPPELARPPVCPELAPDDARGLVSQALSMLEPGEGHDFDGALTLASRVRRCQPSLAEGASLEDALRRVALAEAQTLADAGDHEAARFQLARLAGRLDMGQQLRDLELAWLDVVTEAADADAAAERWASAYVRRELAVWLGHSEAAATARDLVALRFLEDSTVPVHLRVEPSSPLLQAGVEDGLTRVLRWVPDPELAELRGALIVSESHCVESFHTTVAQRSVRDAGHAAALEQRTRAEDQLSLAQAALDEGARGDRRLTAAVAAMDLASPGRKELELLQADEVQAVLQARAALDELGSAPPPLEPFRYELRTGTVECTLAGRISLERADGEPIPRLIEARASTSDSAHPAFIEHDLDEDPLRYDVGRPQLQAQARGDLFAQVATMLEVDVDAGLRASTEQPLPMGADPDQLEAATRAALLLGLLEPDAGEDALTSLLDRHFGVADPDVVSPL